VFLCKQAESITLIKPSGYLAIYNLAMTYYILE